jgi:hypothetical protein
MACDDIKKAMAAFEACEETPEGDRIATHCLYPSFEHVRVFVAKVGDGFRVHDGAGAHNTAWLHGRDVELISKSTNDAAERFGIFVAGKALVAKVDSIDWLSNAILSVANASSLAAHMAVDRIMAAQEEALIDRIGKTLGEILPPKNVAKNVSIKGRSGGLRHFDFVLVRESPKPIYINSVTPRRNSVAAKFVSFSDTDADRRFKFAVHDRELEMGDTALLQQVASVVPFDSLGVGTRRSLSEITSNLPSILG